MNTTFDTDPNTATVAAAWAACPLEAEETAETHLFADREPVTRRPIARHAMLAAALACGIAGGAALGLPLLDVAPASTTVAPGVGTRPSPPTHPVVITESAVPAPAPAPAFAPAPRPVVRPAPSVRQPASVPAPSAHTAPANTPAAPEDPTPAPQGPTVVVDIPPPLAIPPLPPKPEPPKPPQDPDPKPPVADIPDFTLPPALKPEPEPEPKPVPPVVIDDLPLAPITPELPGQVFVPIPRNQLAKN